MKDIEKFAKVASTAARDAGELLMSRFRTDFAVSHKGDVDLVTELDLAAEDLIVQRLSAAFPKHSILAEEKHARPPDSSHIWIIDPLDGTTNYAHGFPFFSVSIALQIEGELEWGTVYNPNLGEVFTGWREGGAFLGSERINVSKTAALSESLLATGFPYDIRTSRDNNLDHFCRFALRARAIRRAGSAALDLCYLAAGRFDGFWEMKLSPWDCAAGYLITREAGGKVTDFGGNEGAFDDGECLATNGLIHEEMLQVLQEATTLTS